MSQVIAHAIARASRKRESYRWERVGAHASARVNLGLCQSENINLAGENKWIGSEY